MRYFCGIFEGSEDFDSIYGIGVLMQSLRENYRQFAQITIPFRAPLFYGIRLFEWDFSLTAKCERELGSIFPKREI